MHCQWGTCGACQLLSDALCVFYTCDLWPPVTWTTGHEQTFARCRSTSNLPKDVHGSGILGTTAGEEVGLSGLPDRSSVVQLMEFGQPSSPSRIPA